MRTWTPPIYVDPRRMTPAVVELIGEAHALANRSGHNSVAGEHVLATLVRARAGSAMSAGLVLDQLTDLPRVKSLIDAIVPHMAGEEPAGVPPLAEPLVAALLMAADYSEAHERTSVTSADLIIGLLGVRDSISSAILEEAGMRDKGAVDAVLNAGSRSLLSSASAALVDPGVSGVDLAMRLTDLDGSLLTYLGARLLESVHRAPAAYAPAARKWILANRHNAQSDAYRLGPLRAALPHSAHAAMRLAYAVGDKEEYFHGLAALASAYRGWGQFDRAGAIVRAARKLNSGEVGERLDALAEGILPSDFSENLIPPQVLRGFLSASAEYAWSLLLRFPQLLSRAGIEQLRRESDSRVVAVAAQTAYLGSWEVAHALLREERLSPHAGPLVAFQEMTTSLCTRRAMNYVEGLPADESRTVTDDDKGSYSRFEYELTGEVSRDFRISAAVAIGHLIASDSPWVTARYAFQFAYHALQQVEITTADIEHLTFAIDCFGVCLANTDPVDARHHSRTIALSTALELRYSLQGDIQSIEDAASTVWQGLYLCTPPDATLSRLYFRVAELADRGEGTLLALPEAPDELKRAGQEWAALDPAYDADLLAVPEGVVERFRPQHRGARLAVLLEDLTDADGRPEQRWAPDSRPGLSWNRSAELAFSLARSPGAEVTAEQIQSWLQVVEVSRRLALERATTVADEAAARFGLVELGLIRLADQPSAAELAALLHTIDECRGHADQLGPARLRRLAQWRGDITARVGQLSDAVSSYSEALAIEEQLFAVQAAVRHRVLSRTTQPSDVALRLAAVQGVSDAAAACDALERGRALVFRSLGGLPEQVAVDEPFLPSCDTSVSAPEMFGRPLSRSSYRLVAGMTRVRGREGGGEALRPADPATLSRIRRALAEQSATLVYLVPGAAGGGVLTVPSAGAARWIHQPQLTAERLREVLPEPDDDTAFGLDAWHERFTSDVASPVWDVLDQLDRDNEPLYFVACGIAAGLPWASAQPAGVRPVRFLASGTQLVDATGPRSEAALRRPNSVRVLAAPASVGRTFLDYAQAEAECVGEKWGRVGIRVTAVPNATVGDVFAALLEPAAVCHIVSHAAASATDPLQQGLAMHNGNLLSGDLLGSRHTLRSSLVVLSSCQSGRAAYELPNELISLASCLVAKGAMGAIGNIWSVDDYANCVFMESLHGLLATEGVHPAQAVAMLQQAARGRDLDFFASHSPSLSASTRPDNFSEDELFAARSWAGLHYVGV